MTTYHLYAGGHHLHAIDLEELAELIECAIAAGDEITLLRNGRGQLLDQEQFAALLELVNTRRQA